MAKARDEEESAFLLALVIAAAATSAVLGIYLISLVPHLTSDCLVLHCRDVGLKESLLVPGPIALLKHARGS